MASRPAFFSTHNEPFVKRVFIDFVWHPGFSSVQKKKSIAELHAAIKSRFPASDPLETSSKSEEGLGKRMSAFNLSFISKNGREVSVESAFQGSKIFEGGGPYHDLYEVPAIDAKKDVRIRSSGKIIGFNFYGRLFPATPKTLFYNWLFINTVTWSKFPIEELARHSVFTDIEFNPDRSLNCQAAVAALIVSLYREGVLEKASNLDYLSRVLGGIEDAWDSSGKKLPSKSKLK